MNAIFKRRSVRKFKNEEIRREEIVQMLKAAMQAPSARNQQPWHFLVIEDKEKIQKLTSIASGARALITAPLVILFLIDNQDLLSPKFAPLDMAASVENFMIEGADLGIGTVWVGIYPDSTRMDGIVNILDIDKRYTPFALVGAGYPDSMDAFTYIDRFSHQKIHFEKM